MNKAIHKQEYKKVIERLRNARVKAGLSQQDVADTLSKPQSYISKIESGERRLDVVEIKNLAEIYKKDVGFFVD